MTGPDRPWVLQRYDHAWGGFRELPRSLEDAQPPRFASKETGARFIRRIRPEHPASTRLALRHDATGELYEPRHQRAAGHARRSEPTMMQVARGLVVELIRWEINVADGASMAAACDRYGTDRVTAALERIAESLEDAGAAHMTEADKQRLGFG